VSPLGTALLHDTEHNDPQHHNDHCNAQNNETQHMDTKRNNKKCKTQHLGTSVSHAHYAECCNTECHLAKCYTESRGAPQAGRPIITLIYNFCLFIFQAETSDQGLIL
jgi:hypothetical protein